MRVVGGVTDPGPNDMHGVGIGGRVDAIGPDVGGLHRDREDSTEGFGHVPKGEIGCVHRFVGLDVHEALSDVGQDPLKRETGLGIDLGCAAGPRLSEHRHDRGHRIDLGAVPGARRVA